MGGVLLRVRRGGERAALGGPARLADDDAQAGEPGLAQGDLAALVSGGGGSYNWFIQFTPSFTNRQGDLAALVSSRGGVGGGTVAPLGRQVSFKATWLPRQGPPRKAAQFQVPEVFILEGSNYMDLPVHPCRSPIVGAGHLQ